MAKPTDFYVGMVAFFAILLPGAVGTLLLMPLLEQAVIGPILALPPDPAARWGAFLIGAYFLGHLMFLIGSYIDPLYGRLRERWHPYGEDSPYQCATRIKAGLLKPTEHRGVNTFEWAQALLTTQWPAAATEVRGLEAESKFFRSVLVVFGLGAGTFCARQQYLAGLVCLVLLVPCFARYYERRLKSTTQAYVYVVTLYGIGKLSTSTLAGPRAFEDRDRD